MWLIRGLGIVGLVLGGIVVECGVSCRSRATLAHAQVAAVGSIVVQGNQRVEADTIRSYFRPGPGGRLDAFQIDEGVKALYATGLFQDVRPTIQGGRLIITVVENPVINRIAFEGNKKVKDEQLKAEIQSKERGDAVSARGAGRRRAPGRSLPAQRPLRRPRRTQDHRTAEQSRRPRLRNHRGREDRRQDDRVRRQSLLFGLPSQGRHQDLADRAAGVPADQRHLRSRPASRRIANCCAASTSSTASSTCASFRRSASTIRRRRGLPDHLHDRGRRAIPRRNGRCSVERARARSGAAAAEAAGLCGRCLQRRGGREDRRGHDDRGGAARLCLRDGPSARDPQSRKRGSSI